MKERPISFSAPMVKAILEGRKTQTRRVVKCPDDTTSIRWVVDNQTIPVSSYTGWVVECGAPLLLPRKCPYGVVGDRLWVKETWCLSPREDWEQWPAIGKSPRRFWQGTMDRPHTRSAWNSVHNAIYKADGDYQSSDGQRCWTSPIHMPRWASRITLEITGVRVERLQSITEADAIAEGCQPGEWQGDDHPFGAGRTTAKYAYLELWESINGPKSWAANPWVWVLEFKKLTQTGDSR